MSGRIQGAKAGGLGGLLATGLMSAVMLAGKRLGVTGELPPERIGRRALQVIAQRPSKEQANAAAAALHFAFGAVAGVLFGALLGRGTPSWLRIPAGLAYGTGIWAVSYLGWIPGLGLLPSAARDRPGRVWVMVVAHWIYGAALGVMHGRLAARTASTASTR